MEIDFETSRFYCIIGTCAFIFQDFFLRALRSQRPIVCEKDSNCPITKETRQNCQYCRLQKCFALGMKRKGENINSLVPFVS